MLRLEGFLSLNLPTSVRISEIAIYSRLKDIVTGTIPGIHPEASLSEAMRGHVCFNHFVDDDCGGAGSSRKKSLPEISFISVLGISSKHFWPF